MTRKRSPECTTVLTRIARYLDGDLPAAKCRDVEDHCRDCADCATAIKGLRETIGLCRAAGRKPLPTAVRRKARAQVKRMLAKELDLRTRRR
jgi:anti-sigma factor RsiW